MGSVNKVDNLYCDKSNNNNNSILLPSSVTSDIFYGVFIPSHLLEESEDVNKIFIKTLECLVLLKKYPGSRFKGFSNYEDAVCFSEYGPIVATVLLPTTNGSDKNESMSNGIAAEKASPYHSLKSQELMKFRKAIEKGNLEFVKDCISTNPRYLVSSGDTPSILQEGFRYNALHVACRHNQHVICKEILETLSSVSFFCRVYPNDPMEVSERRCSFLLDLYLNTPDKGLNESPLHFACKHGALHCVSAMLSYPACDNNPKNKFGQTPLQINCSRLDSADEDLKSRIRAVFEDIFYVPVLRDGDKCSAPCIAPPWSPVLGGGGPHNTPSPPPCERNSSSPISPCFKVSGYAGPMSPQKAESFYSRWRRGAASSPIRNSKRRAFNSPKGEAEGSPVPPPPGIADQRKGIEVVGRSLANELSVDWSEYWGFLGGFANITSLEGLMKLEEHLKRMYAQVVEDRNRREADDTLVRLSEMTRQTSLEDEDSQVTEGAKDSDDTLIDADTTQSSLSTMGALCEELESLRLNASFSPKDDGVTAGRRGAACSNSRGCSPAKASPISADQADGDDGDFYSFAVQSARISAQRIATAVVEVANTFSATAGPNMQAARALRVEIGPEVSALRKVLRRSVTVRRSGMSSASDSGTPPSPKGAPELSFVHVFVAAVAAETVLSQGVAAANVYLAAATAELLVRSMEGMHEINKDVRSSLLELDDVEDFDDEDLDDAAEVRGHVVCVARRLAESLSAAISLAAEGREGDIEMSRLGVCQCQFTPWTPVISDTRRRPVILTARLARNGHIKAKVEEDVASTPQRAPQTGRLARAQAFLRRWLFGSSSLASATEETPNDDDNVDGGNGGEEEREGDGESEGFASAVSSLEGEALPMATPEERIEVFINGSSPSKDDADVLVALTDLCVDEAIFPHVSEWMALLQSQERRGRLDWSQASRAPSSRLCSDQAIRKRLFPKSPP